MIESVDAEHPIFCVEPVGSDLLLDSRLAIFQPESGWMAVADIHYGYEMSRRADGGLFPLWGMGAIEARIDALLAEHGPSRLILLGDIIDSRIGDRLGARWLEALSQRLDVVCVRGNHDPSDKCGIEFVDWHREDGFVFHHGHRSLPELGTLRQDQEVEVVGHFHPSISFGDGAGTSLRLPAMVQDGERWVLPAFSPWAGGGRIDVSSEARFFGCGSGRIICR